MAGMVGGTRTSTLRSVLKRIIPPLVAAALALTGCGEATPAVAPSSAPTTTSAATEAPPASATSTPAEPTQAPTSAPSPSATPELVALPKATARPAPTPFPTPTPVPPRDCVAELPLRVALGQLLIPMATSADFATVANLASNNEVGSVALLGNPSVEEMALLRASDANAGALPLMIASDEEGGRVQRLGPALGALPAAAAMVGNPPESLQETFAEYGSRANQVGLNMVFGPVIDVGDGPAIGDRSFSSDPQVVTTYGQAVINGWQQAGVIPVIKHFPGHGKASADSHFDFATVPSIDELWTSDLVPFQSLANQPGVAVMVAHVQVPGLTGETPASLSPAAIDGLLRTDLGFQGVVITDALDMQAIAARYDLATATELAILAGSDMAIVRDIYVVPDVLNRLEEAVAGGRLTRERIDTSVDRVFNMRSIDPCAAADQFVAQPE